MLVFAIRTGTQWGCDSAPQVVGRLGFREMKAHSHLNKQTALIAALVGLSLITFLPGFFSLPILDRDEARFVQTSAQMVQSGDIIDLRLGDSPRYNKPVGIYWLQAGFASLTGAPEVVQSYRAISQIGALGVVLMTFAIARLVLPISGAFAAAALMGSTLVLGGEARIGKTDAMLLFTILMAIYVPLRAAFQAEARDGTIKFDETKPIGWLSFVMFWGALSAAVLIKGPIVFAVTLPLLLFIWVKSRSAAIFSYLRSSLGILFFLALVLPWYIAITIQSDGQFWHASLVRDFLGKIHQEQESHGAPIGTYLALFWITFFPASMVFAATLPAIWRARRSLWMQMALVWVVPMWIGFELASTKLPHYVMPTYPAIAITVIWAAWRDYEANQAQSKYALILAAIIGLVPIAVLGAFAYGAEMVRSTLSIHFYIGAGLTVIFVPIFWIMIVRRAWQGVGIFAFAVSFSIALALYPSLARMERLWPSNALAAEANLAPNCEFWVAGYWEASLLFLTNRNVNFASGADVAEQFNRAFEEGHCIQAAIANTELAEFVAAQPNLTPIKQLDLFNFGDGEDIVFNLFVAQSRS